MMLFTASIFYWIIGLTRQARREEGQALAEYGLIIALVVAIGIMSIAMLVVAIVSLYGS